MKQPALMLRIWARPIFALAVIALLAVILFSARETLGPYLLGIMVAYLLLPIVRRVERWFPADGRWAGLARPVAAIGTFLVALFGLLLLLGILLSPVLDQTTELFENLDDYWDELHTEHSGFRDWYEDEVPEQLQAAIERNISRIGHSILAGVAGLAGWVLSTSDSLLSAAIALFAVPLFVVYYLLEEKETTANLKRQLPPAWIGDATAVFRIVDRILGSYTRGVVVEAALVGLITGFGYWLIGVELALPLGVIAFAGEIVPILGPWIAFAVSFPVVLVTQPELAIPAIALFGVIQALEGWFLAPKIQGDSVEFTSAGTLLIIAMGGAIAGAIGVVVALPAAAILRAVIVYVSHRLDGEPPEVALGKVPPFRDDRQDAPVDEPHAGGNTSEMRLSG